MQDDPVPDITDDISAPPAPFERSGLFVPLDTPHCKSCGFSLHGLPEVGICPECGKHYNPVTSRQLAQPPTAGRALLYVGFPLLIAGGIIALVVAIENQPGLQIGTAFTLGWLAALCVSICVWWTGHRIFRGTLAFTREVLPEKTAQRRSMQTAGCVLSLVATLMIGGGILASIGSVIFFGICVVEGAEYMG